LPDRLESPEVREQVSIQSSQLAAALRAFRELEGVLGCAILSTCNRFEVTCMLNEDTLPEAIFAQFLAGTGSKLVRCSLVSISIRD